MCLIVINVINIVLIKKNVFIRVRICVYCDRVVCIAMVNGIVMVSATVNGFVSDIRMSTYCVSLVLRVL